VLLPGTARAPEADGAPEGQHRKGHTGRERRAVEPRCGRRVSFLGSRKERGGIAPEAPQHALPLPADRRVEHVDRRRAHKLKTSDGERKRRLRKKI